MLKKLTSHHVLEVITILRQVYLDAALCFVDNASECHAANLPDFISSVLFQCVSSVRFVTEQSFLKKTREKKSRRSK
jgi:hypothetical protein